jgi:putative heme-binding domain-containing protein
MRLAIRSAISLGLVLITSVGFGEPQPPKEPEPENVSSKPPRSPADERQGFHLPPGFEAQLVAAEPDIHKPINIAFDAHGRLWVTNTIEYPFAAKPGTKARDRVSILEDFAPDGRARKITTFADDLNIPIGVLPITGGALVYSIPNIYRMRDTDGDGKADKREVLYGPYGHDDTHGMTGEFTPGFDGWIYVCHGYSNTSTVKGSDGQAITMNSGNTYRMKLDGSHLEYFTHGQVNPFGLTFDPLGNLYSCDCETRPVYMLLRGAYYPSFGKPHDGLGFAPEMIDHGHGSTAIAGITYYAADHFPAEYRDTFFIGNVVTNRINRDRLERHGSTLKAIQQADFLRSDDPWFRPVDIKLGPDGALYVADFYNRIIGHYEVPLDHPGRDRERGRIWRIVYRGPDGKTQPMAPRRDWTKATVAELVQDLAHPNLTVRMLAMNQLVERGGQPGIEAVRKLMQPKSNPWQRMHGLWVLDRQRMLDDKTLTAAAKDAESGVRVHAMRVLAEREAFPAALRELVLAGLKDSDAFVQRAAADALGRHPAPENLRPLLDLRHTVPADDTHLLHVVRMALRDQLIAKSAWQQLPLADWTDRDARAIADVAPGIPTPEAAAFLLHHVQHYPESPERLVEYVHHSARYGTDADRQALLNFARANRPQDVPHLLALFKAIQQGSAEAQVALSKEARSWAEELVRHLLAAKDEAQLLAGIEFAGSLQMRSMEKPLATLAADKKTPEAQRRAALVALVAINPKGHVPLLGQVLTDATAPIGLREHAANLLARLNQPAAHEELLKALALVPARLEVTIAAGLASSRSGAEKLFDAVAAGKASARLLQERQVEVQLASHQLPDLKARLTKLTQGLPPADQKLQELLQHRREGFTKARTDPALGVKVYEKHCANCHQLANKGTKVGPQLDGIGIRGVDRLLEDILDPNRNVDQAFRATMLNLKDGRTVVGLLLREQGAVLVLADSQGKEIRVDKALVEEQYVSQLSPMPANLVDQIPEADFYNLLAYLLTQQPAKGGAPPRSGS